MNKKGSHVDWVISMGIFITYIFVLFILLKPGVTPVYKPVTLLDNLQEQFESEVMWTVKSVPLFVRKCLPGPVINQPTRIRVSVSNGWSIGNVIDNKGKDDYNLIFEHECNEETPNIFYFYLYNEQDPGSVVIFNEGMCNEEYCNVELGVIEKIYGINPSKLNLIFSKGYENLKTTEWGVPSDKDFAIFEDDLSGNRAKIIGAEPYDKANVFVRRIESQFVEKEGGTTPVVVYLQIW